MIVVYPGSFDPITYGHLDIIKRCSKKFDKVIISILKNDAKKTLFNVQERVALIKEATKHLDNIEVDSFSGLLVDYVKQKNISLIVKGLRMVADFEYEMQMAMINKRLNKEVETVFLMSSSEYIFLSSSAVKQAARAGGDISGFVPPIVREAINQKIKGV
ncbi:pantetheine-phosphate adenylyltransferase [Clostridiaceae bacterium M8S5]|nr:pantetheine-phosphate adenylyltransferase [Clostridiaceae bacterium M8S5]